MSDDTSNVVALFKGAKLPTIDPGQFRVGLTRAATAITVASGDTFLKMDKRDGAWSYGAKDTEVQEGSKWAINPTTIEIGFISWNPKGGKPLGKVMRSIFVQPVLSSELPETGAGWSENVSFQLMCLNGEDKGQTVTYTNNSYGAKKAFNDLTAAFQRQLGEDPLKIVPVVSLTNDSYVHNVYGTTFNPIFEILDWIPMAPAPAADVQDNKKAETVAEQPAATKPTPTTRPRRAAVTDVEEQPAQASAPAEKPTPPEPSGPVTRRRRRAAAE